VLIWAYGNRIAATLLLLVAGVAWCIAGSWRALHIRAAAAVLTFLAQGTFDLHTLSALKSADCASTFSLNASIRIRHTDTVAAISITWQSLGSE
jgi:hypothetical protein